MVGFHVPGWGKLFTPGNPTCGTSPACPAALGLETSCRRVAMTVDSDIAELTSSIKQSLDASGGLSVIRAQLRAQVFGLRSRGLGLGGSGLRAWGSELEARGSGLGPRSSALARGSGLEAQGSGLGARGAGLGAHCSGLEGRGSGLGARVSGLGSARLG